MNVVLEGPDGGGKSTLAQALSTHLDMRVQEGAGPPKAPGEIEARLRSYLGMTETIFDRHPAVSQPIYASIRGELLTEQFATLLLDFYRTPTVLVYVRSTCVLNHVVKPGESEGHIKMLTDRYQELVSAYDDWALRNAHLVWRIGDDVERLANMLRGTR